jgi:hypothetical protein
MASSRQISANRKNAQKNTGPKSVEAKESVRLNALRHGLSAAAQILPGENQAEFDHLEAQFTSEYPPESGLEGFFLDQMITCAWRLRRVAKVESDVFQHFQAEIDNPPARIVGIAGVSGFDDPAYDGEAAGPDNWQDAGAPTFITAPSAPPAVAATPGQAFLKASTEADLFAKIDRHEATIRAGFYRAFYELQRLRAARAAGTTLQN